MRSATGAVSVALGPGVADPLEGQSVAAGLQLVPLDVESTVDVLATGMKQR